MLKKFFIKQIDAVKKDFASETIKSFLLNALIVVLGSIIYAIGSAFFVLPANLITGGITSIAIIVGKYIPVATDTLILIITWSFFALGLLTLGLKYSIRALIFAVSNPLFIMLFQYLIKLYPVLDVMSTTNVAGIENPDVIKALAYVISAIFGGSLLGVGVGVAIMGGGSSGGTDVVNLLVKKYFHVKVGVTSFIQDVIIIVIGFFVNDKNLVTTCFGIMGALLCSLLIDKVSLGSNEYYVAMICTNMWEEINERLMEDSSRGTTLISIRGGYSKVDTYLVEICFDKRDYATVKGTILKCDPNAFVQIMKASEVLGYGFTRKTPTVEDLDKLKLPEKEIKYYLTKGIKHNKNEDK